MPPHIETPYLIVGCGPAGASLACFLASHGLNGIMVSAASGTAKEPRAHITNPAALECLREIGLEPDCLRDATPQSHMQHTRWCHDVAGRELARIHSWGNQPNRRGSYDAASPCHHVDLPQTLLEPILVGHATVKGWTVRFDTQLLSFEVQEDGFIVSNVKDLLSEITYTIRSRYLFGCDGARSQIMRQLDLPLDKKPGQGLAINLLVKADLHQHMRHRTGNLHWIFQPEVEHPPWAWTCVLRMVKAWNEWMFILLPEPGFEELAVQPSEAEYLKRVREFIGDDSIEVEILGASKWYINEIVATRYSEGNIFCLGDAVHRHPPFNGLGSNTCIQDAYNLAWKIAYVDKSLASTDLLKTFSHERQPVGAGVVHRANQGLRDHMAVWEALGVLPADVQERKRQHAELTSPSEAGQIRRKRFHDAVAYTEHEFGALGIEFNLAYESSAIYPDDEAEGRPALPKDPVLHYQISTYPGSRLPHAWLNTAVPDRAPVSTQDLAGHGAFCLFTGNGGDNWKTAVQHVFETMRLQVNCYSIGWSQDYEDVYGDWARRRQVADDGAVLCRPDRIVCWRSMSVINDPGKQLIKVLSRVLGKSS